MTVDKNISLNKDKKQRMIPALKKTKIKHKEFTYQKKESERKPVERIKG